MRFSGKVAIVTGGAGGVGRALVRKLTREGTAVIGRRGGGRMSGARGGDRGRRFLTGEIIVLDGGRTAKLPLPS